MTDCTRCGDCCERIVLNAPIDFVNRWGRPGMAGPDQDWPAWEDAGWSKDDARAAWEANRPDALFIHGHWSIIAGTEADPRYECDQFDRDARLCQAHDQRPPLCAGYPWYDRPAGSLFPVGGVTLPERCSFNVDIGIPVALTARSAP